MKHFILISISLVLLSACQKQIDKRPASANYLETVKASLKDSLSAADYSMLDFSKPVLTKIDSAAIYVLKISINGKNRQSDFVLVKTDVVGEVEKGRIIHLERTNAPGETKYDGNISIKELNGKLITASPIENGFIKAFQNPDQLTLQKAEYITPDPYVELPEVVIVSTYSSGGGGVDYSTWVSLMSVLNENSGGGSYYSNMDGSDGGYSGGGGEGYNGGYSGGHGGGTSEVIETTPIKIDFENQYSDPAIDVSKYMKCFSTIPDVGSTCSIEIFADIPVNGDANKFFDWENGSPGHVFIQLKKSNSQQSVSQNIGFYPRSGWKTTITPAPIAGKFVDNHHHEFNASYKVNLTAAQLQTAITRVLYLSGFSQYDIDDNNCTDWALDVFNNTVKVEEKLTIPLYDIPGGMAPNGTSTPQGLYKKLQQMKQAGGANAANINLPLVGWVGASKGSCD